MQIITKNQNHNSVDVAVLTRLRAIDIIVQVIYKQQSLQQIAWQDLGLAAVELSLCKALVFNTIRYYHQTDSISQQLLRQQQHTAPLIRVAILAGLTQLLYMKIPAYAAVATTVAVIKIRQHSHRLVAVVNAVLRNFLRQQDVIVKQLEHNASAKFAHPAWLVTAIQRQYPATALQILTANNQQAPLILRANDREQLANLLAADGIATQTVDGAPDALLLPAAQDVTTLAGFLLGMFSVQDAASQQAAYLLELAPQQRVLDACAAPGGKAAHIMAMAKGDIALTAVDSDAFRLAKLRANCQRLQQQINIVESKLENIMDWHTGEQFDRILLDAPCSATGVIRRHPDIKLLRRASDVPVLASKQLQFLQLLWPLLAKGGVLVYATCSYLAAENDAVMAEFLRSTSDAAWVPLCHTYAQTTTYGMQFSPHLHPAYDGFYYAKLSKK